MVEMAGVEPASISKSQPDTTSLSPFCLLAAILRAKFAARIPLFDRLMDNAVFSLLFTPTPLSRGLGVSGWSDLDQNCCLFHYWNEGERLERVSI